MTEQNTTAVLEYHKSLREEIYLRVGEHTRLVQIKVISLAAIIAFLFKDEKINNPAYLSSSFICLIWTVPLAGIVFDTMIASNLRVINNLGVYIRNYLEGMALAQIKQATSHKLIATIPVKDVGTKSCDSLFCRLWTAILKRKSQSKGDLISKELRQSLKKRGLILGKLAGLRKDGDNWWLADESRELFIEKDGENANVYQLFGFWEEKAAQATRAEYHCYRWFDILVIWLFTLSALMFCFMLDMLEHHINPNFQLWYRLVGVACTLGSLSALSLLWKALTIERRF